MRKFLVLAASSALATTFGALPGAHAATNTPHGCVSAALVVVASSGNPTPAGTAPCSFPMVAGDTFSGVGPLTVTCGTTFSQTLGLGETANMTPINCAAGDTVTLDTTAGGAGAAGNTQ